MSVVDRIEVKAVRDDLRAMELHIDRAILGQPSGSDPFEGRFAAFNAADLGQVRRQGRALFRSIVGVVVHGCFPFRW